MANKIPVDKLRGVVNMGREAEESMEEGMHISILVDNKCPRWLALAIRDAMMPQRDARVDVSLLDGHPSVVGLDLGIIISGGSEALLRGAIRMFATARQNVIVVAESSLDIPETNLPAKMGKYLTTVVASEHGPLLDRFATALLDATEKDVSCAANFSFCREIATARLVSKCAAYNALMGVADFIPGAGMPLMSMNQLNLNFDIAATYGHGLSVRRVPEVIMVMALGLVYRGAARMALRAVPSLGLLIKAGFAYGGTLITGRMLSTHFTAELPEASEDLPIFVESVAQEA